MKMTEGGLQIEYTTSEGLFLTYRDKTPLTASIRNIQYVADLAMAAQTKAELQEMFEVLETTSRKYGMKINEEKTKIQIIEHNIMEITNRNNIISSWEVMLLRRWNLLHIWEARLDRAQRSTKK